MTQRAAEKLQAGAAVLSAQTAIDQVVEFMRENPDKVPLIQHAVMGAKFVYARVVTKYAWLSRGRIAQVAREHVMCVSLCASR